jgi:siroheme synthase
MSISSPHLSSKSNIEAGTVYLVGAGPGDPELITVRGLRRLRAADAVLYDKLAPQELLDEAPPHARLINVGKAPNRHCMVQEDINRLIIELAQEGLNVVRLKGGDPFVFGRGGEEALALRAANIPFEVVPGVTSSIAAPAAAGIPVTFQHLARSFAVITGHSRLPLNRRLDRESGDTINSGMTDKEVTDGLEHHNWAALAGIDTLVCLMSVRSLPSIVARLLDNGRSPETPVAIVERGATPEQRVTTGALSEISDIATRAGVRSPAAIVIGNVVALHQALKPIISENSTDQVRPISLPPTEFPIPTPQSPIPSPISQGANHDHHK